MTVESKLFIIAAALLGIPLFLLMRHILRSKRTPMQKRVYCVLFLILAVPIWYLVSFLLYTPVANIFWNDLDVPCFVLTEANCQKRTDCYSDIVIGGLGRDQPFCYRGL